jgi:hypothetical protein
MFPDRVHEWGKILGDASWVDVPGIGPDGDVDAVETHLMNGFRHFVSGSQPLEMPGEDVDFERFWRRIGRR